MNDEQISRNREEAARLRRYIAERAGEFTPEQVDNFTDYLVAVVIGFFADGDHLSDTFKRLVSIAAGEVEHTQQDFGE